MERTGGRFSLGPFTAVALFYPTSIACYWRAAAEGALGAGGLIGLLVLGTLSMASPIVLLKIKTPVFSPCALRAGAVGHFREGAGFPVFLRPG